MWASLAGSRWCRVSSRTRDTCGLFWSAYNSVEFCPAPGLVICGLFWPAHDGVKVHPAPRIYVVSKLALDLIAVVILWE